MSKFDRLGVWAAPDGRVAMTYCYPDPKGKMLVAVREPSDGQDVNFYEPYEVEGDYWQEVELPKFPPPKQPMVYARAQMHEPDWWMVRPGKFAVTFDDRSKSGYTALFKDLVVLPHPDNDPEAVRLIEAAKA